MTEKILDQIEREISTPANRLDEFIDQVSEGLDRLNQELEQTRITEQDIPVVKCANKERQKLYDSID